MFNWYMLLIFCFCDIMLCNLRRFLIRFYRNIHFNIGKNIWKNNIRVLFIPKHKITEFMNFYNDVLDITFLS